MTRTISHTQDRCKANDRQVTAARQIDDVAFAVTQSRLALDCDVHRSAACTTKVFDLCSSQVSGMLALAIAQRVAGCFAILKRMLTNLCASKLLIISRQPPTAEAKTYGDATVDFLLPLGRHTTEHGQWQAGSVSQQT